MDKTWDTMDIHIGLRRNKMSFPSKFNEDSMKKMKQLEAYRSNNDGQTLTTDNALKLTNTDDSLKAGDRGPTLLEDFHFREKITHFDHERIPERVVHARGFGAHGYFELYESMAAYTRADFLQVPGSKTPVFVRFSTVVGSRGSADTVRDVRGFATKFYTKSGNYDIVGNNIPIFFIQDAIKFPDLIHAVKPEPNNEIPQATTAHDTFWDFVVNAPETAHMVMWAMSDRAIPRSFRMMEGFGVNTFRFINAQGKARFVKISLEAVARCTFADAGRSAKALGQRPRLPPPGYLGRDRAGQLSRVRIRRANDRRGSGIQF
jgi:Catalase